MKTRDMLNRITIDAAQIIVPVALVGFTNDRVYLII